MSEFGEIDDSFEEAQDEKERLEKLRGKCGVGRNPEYCEWQVEVDEISPDESGSTNLAQSVALQLPQEQPKKEYQLSEEELMEIFFEVKSDMQNGRIS